MRIAVFSDSHDHVANLHRAVQLAKQQRAEMLLHCGDLISPFMLPYLQAFGGPVHLIYGNNIGDQHLIASRCGTTFDNIRHHGVHGTLSVGTLRIAFNHYPELAYELARSGSFDLVCYGHDHLFHVEQVGDCLLLNPGDLLGKDAAPGFVLVETNSGDVQRIEVGPQMVLND